MDKILLTGRIEFEPENVTKKHNLQASWKHIAMVLFDGDITDYYAWFIKKRYNLILNKPLRGGHVSFINDSFKEMSMNGKRSMEEVKQVWAQVKKRWDGIEIPVMLDIEPRFNKKHWWLIHQCFMEQFITLCLSLIVRGILMVCEGIMCIWTFLQTGVLPF